MKINLLEAIVLLTVGTIPAVPVPIWYSCILATEPAVHLHVGWLLPAKKTYKLIRVAND